MLTLRRILYSLAILCQLGSLPVIAQRGYTIKNFTNENGLSQNSITAMAMDYSGYLWIGTQEGLIRYDGSSFKTFLLDEKRPDAFHNSVWNLMNTPFDRQLMVRAKDGILYNIVDGRPRVLDSTVKDDFYATIFFGQYPTKAIQQQFNLRTKEMAKQLNWRFKMQIVPLGENEFIMASDTGRVFSIYKNNRIQKKIETPVVFRKLLRSQNSCIVVGRQSDIYLFDYSTLQFTKLEIDQPFRDKLSRVQKDIPAFYQGLYTGNSFMSHANTLYILKVDAGRKKLHFIPQFTLTENHQWTQVVYDTANATFFLGTANEGIFQVKLKKINSLNYDAYLPAERIYNDFVCYAVLATGDKKVITPGGIQLTVSDTGIAIQKTPLFSTRQTIAPLGDSAVLCTVPQGLFYYLHREKYKVPHVFNEPFNVQMQKIYSEVSLLFPEGDSVWVSCLQHLFCVTRTGIKEYTPPRQRVPFQLFYRTNKNEILVSDTKGLYKLKLSPAPVLEIYPGMNGVVTRHISAYKDVLIASGYRSGLYILKDNKSYKMPASAELTDLRTCHSTYIDKDGMIWITTNRGLYKSSAEAVVRSALTQGPPPYFFCYGRNDGIDNLEFNGGGTPAYASLPDGRLFYPSMDGVVSFNPANLKDKTTAGPVFIQSIAIDKKISEPQDSIYLPADFSVVDIQLSAANFGDPRNLVLEYKLDHDEWERIATDKEPHITLLKLSSGWHQLAIRKRTGFGENDFVYRHLFIKRNKKITEQWWFFPLVILLLAGLIWLLLKWHARSLIKKREQLQELVDLQTEELSKAVEAKDMMISIITHDMLTPLKHVSFIAAVLEKGMEKDPQKITEALNDIRQTSDKIHSGSQSIVNWMKYNNKNVAVNKQSLHLYSFAESVLDVYRAIAKNKNTELLNEVRRSAVVEVDHNIFATIVTNIISNAVKHTANGEIKIETAEDKTDGKTILRVVDTGAGMDEATLSIIREVLKGNLQALKTGSRVAPGLGYIIISELIKIHNLAITIDSEPGKGTTVCLFI